MISCLHFFYQNYDGLGLAELIKSRQIQVHELLEEVIKFIELENPKINAVVNKLYDQARKNADHFPQGTFAGVPILLKNSAQEIEGELITSGSRALQNYRSKRDAEYVRRIRKTGAIILGQTNVPEFGLMGITEPVLYGPTRNPWNIDYTPGGSSGGSGAAVAAGMVPIAGANDGGGSIRIPAAYCGLFGLKPTRGRTPIGPHYGRLWQGAAVEHVVTRTVRDSAAMLDELKIYEKAAAFHTPHFLESYLDYVDKPLDKQIRIAFSMKSPIGTEVHPECQKAVMNTVRLLESMGYEVEEKEPNIDGRKLAYSYLTMYFGEVASAIASLEEVLGRKAKVSDVEPKTWLLKLLGKATTAEEYVLSLKEWDKAAYEMECFHERYDFYMTPTTAFPPLKIGESESPPMEKVVIQWVNYLGLGGMMKKIGMVEQIANKSLMLMPFTQLANLTGQPAMSVPLHQTENHLPCGVQFMAAKGREERLIQLAAELEQTENWIKPVHLTRGDHTSPN